MFFIQRLAVSIRLKSSKENSFVAWGCLVPQMTQIIKPTKGFLQQRFSKVRAMVKPSNMKTNYQCDVHQFNDSKVIKGGFCCD